jgi:hypothetical protein
MSDSLCLAAPASIFSPARWAPLVSRLAKQYQAAAPFPHIHLTDFLDSETANIMASEFPQPCTNAWIHYKHGNESKSGLSRRDLFPPHIGHVIDELNSEPFLSWLCELTGIPDLMPDPSLDGGGLHQAGRGGFVNVHTDFSVHHYHSNWRRRVNLILYLNPDWLPTWGGALEFWDKGMKNHVVEYLPLLNHVVIFNTDQDSLHGFPDPLRCPQHVSRKSLALYYYTAHARSGSVVRSTNYHARPSDGLLKSIMIRFDTSAVSLYSKAKRRLGFSDCLASRLLNIVARKKTQKL